MVSQESVDEQINKIGFNLNGWGRAELKELPHILLPGEEIFEVVNGYYEGGFALAVATDVRLLLIDKKPMKYLTVEDIRFDMISEIDYSHRLVGAEIHISTGLKDLNFRSFNQPRLRKLIGHVQHCMAASKKQLTQTQTGQSQHLESINEQLREYLKAQAEYQAQIAKLQIGQKDTAVPSDIPKPELSHELSDYLFARSLLNQYQTQTGVKVDDEFGAGNLDVVPNMSQTSAVTTSDMNDLWKAGVEEVFKKKPTTQFPKVSSSDSGSKHYSFEIHPVSVVFSKLPMLIRNRKLARLSTEFNSGTIVS
ncbi:MAG: PH domain-containing protein [Candidatus Saccharimonadales bacterium]